MEVKKKNKTSKKVVFTIFALMAVFSSLSMWRPFDIHKAEVKYTKEQLERENEERLFHCKMDTIMQSGIAVVQFDDTLIIDNQYKYDLSRKKIVPNKHFYWLEGKYLRKEYKKSVSFGRYNNRYKFEYRNIPLISNGEHILVRAKVFSEVVDPSYIWLY